MTLLKRMCKILVISYIVLIVALLVVATPYGSSSIESDVFIIGPQGN